jgi:hypothetical protein
MAMYIYAGDDGSNDYSDEDIMVRQNAPYYRMWQDRYGPLGENYYLYMEFSQQYFEKLKTELESAGYEITVDRQLHCWYSPPVGCFGVSYFLKGESFCFFVM